MKNVKVLHIISKMGIGGAQKIVLDLANNLSAQGVQIHILVLFRTPQDKEFVSSLNNNVSLVGFQERIPVLKSDFTSFGMRLWHIFMSPIGAWRWVLKGHLSQYDCVHCHLLSGSFVSWCFDVFCRLFGKRRPLFVETYHADGTSNSWFEKLCFRFFWGHLDVLVTELSKRDYQTIKKRMPAVKVLYQPFGVDILDKADTYALQEFKKTFGLQDEIPTIVTIARLNNDEKHIDKLFIAMAEVKKIIGSNFRYIVCGDGPDANSLKALAKSLRIDEETIFTGYLEKITLPLSMANVFFVAGVEDMIGIAGLQAASLGVPVVSFQTDEKWKNRRGYFWNSPDIFEIAKEISRLINDEKYNKDRGAKDQATVVEDFSLSAMVSAYLAIYQNGTNEN